MKQITLFILILLSLISINSIAALRDAERTLANAFSDDV